jgi:class 3 adenylate cyclase
MDLITRVAGLGLTGTESAGDRLRKEVLTVSSVAVVILSCAWVGIYAWFGLWLSAAIPAAYQVSSLVSLAWFARSKRYDGFRASQLVLILLLPFGLQWSLGGFAVSGMVMIWAVMAPFGAIIFHGAHASIPWFLAFIALTVLSGLADPRLAAHAVAFPAAVRLLFTVMNIGAVASVTYALLQYAFRQRELMQAALEAEHRLLQAEQERSESLLLNVLPAPIAARLKQRPGSIADGFPEVTVLFSDIVHFTQLSSRISPHELVAFLNEVFSLIDRLAERHGLEKIKTIGDAYMAAAGLPEPRPDHAEAVADMALAMRTGLALLSGPDGNPLQVRIGINTGSVVAGVIGRSKFSYDLWGDAVNLASRMESHGVAGEIHVSESTYLKLKDRYILESRGLIQVKGKGDLPTWLLRSRR